jgi:hypothetical protein
MSTLTQASKQWATRPEEERFTSLTAMEQRKDAILAALDAFVSQRSGHEIAQHLINDYITEQIK